METDLRELVAGAVGRRFDEWSAEHPALAGVIDRVRLTEQVAASVRDSPEFRRAVEAYRHGRGELDLAGRAAELASAALRAILG